MPYRVDEQHPLVTDPILSAYGMRMTHCTICGTYTHDEVNPPADYLCDDCEERDAVEAQQTA